MRKFYGLFLLFLFVLTVQKITAQTAPSGIKPNLAAGEVTAINQSENKISMQTTDGAIDVLIVATTAFKKIPPDNPSIGAAVDSTFAELGDKDKILVTGKVSDDKKTITAKNIYLMTQSDINKRNQAERELWRTRGINGKVVSVDFKTQAVTISTPARGMMPGSNVVISPKENAQYLRYAPDSVKFSDAVGSSLAEIKVGDELRALGDRGTDGMTFKAEKYLSGSFKTIAGKVLAIDVAKSEITMEDPETKKPVVVVVKNTTVLKKFPEEQAKMMAMAMSGGMQMMQAGGNGGTNVTMTRPPQGGQPNGQNPPTTPNAGNGQTGNPQQGGRPQGMGMGRGGNFDDLINNLPNLTLAELKVGESIGLSTSPGNVPNRFTAIKLISGVEPFLSIPQRGMPGGGGGNNQPTFNIPGLDGGIGN